MIQTALIAGVLALLVVVGFVFYRRWRGQNPELAAGREEVRNRRREVKVAEKPRRAAIEAVEKSIDSAIRERDKACKAARKRLAVLEDPKGKRLQSYRGVSLYELWITTPHGEGSVVGVNASVDSQPSSRITATRLLTIGIFAFAAKKKTGAVYLSIDGPTFSSVVECPQDDNTSARQFAVKIANAARAAEGLQEQRPQLIASARQQLEAANDSSEVNAHRAKLLEVETDEQLKQPIGEARASLDAAEARLVQLLAG